MFKRIFFITLVALLIIAVALSFYYVRRDTVKYSFDFINDGKDLEVTTHFNGNLYGNSDVAMIAHLAISQSNINKLLNIKFDIKGAEIKKKTTKSYATGTVLDLQLKHAPLANIIVRYSIPSPYISDSKNAFYHINPLLASAGVPKNSIINFEIDYSKISSPQNTILHSLNDSRTLKKQYIKTTAVNMGTSSIIIGKKDDILTTEWNDPHTHSKFKTFGLGLDKTKYNQIVDLTKKIISAQHNFFARHKFENAIRQDNTYNFMFVNAKHIDNSYNLMSFYQPKNTTSTIIINSDNIDTTAITIAYEYVHRIFVTTGLFPAYKLHDTDNKYWFMEGFAAHFRYVTLLESGIISMKEYMHLLNTDIRWYLESKFHDEKILEKSIKSNNSSIATTFIGLQNEFMALILDSDLKQATHNKYTLKNLVTNLIDKCDNKAPCGFSQNDLEDIMTNKFGLDKDFGKKYLMNTKKIVPLHLSKYLYNKKMRLVHKQIPNFEDFGFDVPATMNEDMTVQNVNRHGNAYKAGLRNGQKIISAKKDGLHYIFDIETSAGKAKTIRYKTTITKVIPQYEITT